ncbi:MAG: TetR/AcrR family transcriptional regulator [Planctomycetaceae bacterium]
MTATSLETLPTEKPLERDRTAEIYRAAAELIVQKGLDATSMNDIAQAVDLTKPGLYHYITGKKDLLFAIMQFAMDTVESFVIEPAGKIADAEDRLRFLLNRHAGMTEYVREITILTEELPALNPDHRQHIIARKRHYLNFLRQCLNELRLQGKLRDLDVDVAALNVLATVLGISRWFDPGGRLSAEQVAEETSRFILAGLLNSE